MVHQSVIGMQDPERATPLAEDSVYRIYSMTKPVTSVALMTLVEEGLIALDDPVAREEALVHLERGPVGRAGRVRRVGGRSRGIR